MKPDSMLFAATSLDVLEAAEGKPARIDILAYDGGLMNVPGFGPVVVDLAGMEIAKTISFLRDHENTVDSLVGQGEARIEAGKLHASGFITEDTEAGQSVIKLSKPTNGRPAVKFQASIGASVQAKREVRAGEVVSVNGRRITASGAGFTLISKSLLREVTVCVLGCDPGTSVSIAAREGKMSQNTAFDAWLAENTFDPATITDAQKTVLTAAFEAGKAPKTPEITLITPPKAASEADPVAELRAKAGAEAARIAEVTEVTKDHPELRAKAIGGGWSKVETELAVLRDERATAPAAHVRSGAPTSANVIEAALAQAGRFAGLEKTFKPEVLEAAHTRYRGRIGLQEILMEAAWQGGYTGHSATQAIRGDLREVLRAAFSTVSLPGIMANTANKFLLEGFTYSEDAWRAISSNRSVSDFKQVTSYRLTDNMIFEKVSKGGELKHGKVGEESYTNQIETYGKMMALTRVDIINDDLGALTSVPRLLGTGAGDALNSAFWTEWLDDSAFFSSGNANYITGAGTTLQVSQLDALNLKFLNQTKSNGTPLGIMPSILLVPPALWTTALEIMQSTNFNSGGAATDTKIPNKNIWANRFQIVMSTYLTAGSSTAWYLMADPNRLSAIEVAFLNGVQSPTVETAEADFNTLGVQMRAYMDFGMNLQDYRAACKSKGAV
jgi:hypothetical protein